MERTYTSRGCDKGERDGEKEGLESSALSELTSFSEKCACAQHWAFPLLLSFPLFQFNFKTILKKIVGDSSKSSASVTPSFSPHLLQKGAPKPCEAFTRKDAKSFFREKPNIFSLNSKCVHVFLCTQEHAVNPTSIKANILPFFVCPLHTQTCHSTSSSGAEKDLKQKKNFSQIIKKKKVHPPSRPQPLNEARSVRFGKRSPVRERWSCEQL